MSPSQRARLRSLALLCCLLPFCLTSCLNFQYTRIRGDTPVDDCVPGVLAASPRSMQACLDYLGAPSFVERGAGSSTELVWTWKDETRWGLSVSYRVAASVSPSLSYTSGDADLDALRLRFDADHMLTEAKFGKLRDFLRASSK